MRGTSSSSSSGGVLMDFPPGDSKRSAMNQHDHELRSVDSASSLSSTVFEDELDASTAASAVSSVATPTADATSSAAELGFEPSKFFRFAAFAGDNNDVLPPRTVSPSNQSTHDLRSESHVKADNSKASASISTAASSASRAPPLGVRSSSLGGPRPQQRAQLQQPHHHVSSRRKNSIEMFLSQSPSQALGGGFLKMALDDHPEPVNSAPPAHRLPPRRHEAGVAGAPGARTVVVSINQPPVSSPELEIDPRESDGGLIHKDPSTSSAMSGHHGGYLMSHSPPAVDTDDEWSSTSSQEMLSGSGTSSAAAAAYYYEQQQQQQQQAYAYGASSSSSNYRSTYAASDAYASSSRVVSQPLQQQQQQHLSHQHQQSSWNASPVGHQQSSYNSSLGVASAVPSPYGMSSGLAPQYQQPQSQASQLYHQHPQQHQQQQQLYGPQHHQHPQSLGHRAPPSSGGRHYGRSQSMFASSSSSSGRMMMMESSPPPSPHTGGAYGLKQCKFFLQGHCRMGNKCKFAHHSNSSAAPSPAPYHQQHQSHQQQPHQQQLHQSQSFHLAHASPATSPHHHHQQQHQAHDYDAFASSTPTPSSYMPRGGNSGRASYRMGGGDLHHHHSSSSAASMGVPSQSPHHHQHHSLGGLQSVSSSSSGPLAGSQQALPPVDALLKIEDVLGRVFSMSKDQNGCRLLQEQLEYYDERKALCDVIYSEAMDHLAEMMVDPFGNYLFQKLLERARPLQRLEIVRRVGAHLVAAALNLHGTRSVQKVVEVCATSAQVVELDSDGNELRRVNLPDLIVDALKDDAVRLCIDSNGNHVIQRALQFMKPEYNQFVFDAVCKECTTVGTHRHGCCVLQRCLDAANDTQKREVITQVEKQAMKLMQDPYGNYVVQYVLDSCTAEEAYGVIVKPLGNVFELSIQKFSSNVIEKCLEKAPPAVLKQYVEEITTCPKMQKMLQDQFANYVVQRALCVATEDQCLALVKSIRPHLPAMKNTSGGRRITARILKRFPHMDLNLDLGFEPVGPVGMGGYGMNMGIGMSMGMGMGLMQQYSPESQHHAYPPQQQQQQQQQYQQSYSSSMYGMMPSLRDTNDHGSAFAASGGLGLHNGGSGRM